MEKDLTRLTPGERLLLWRLRQPAENLVGRQGRNGRWLSVNAAAEQLTVSVAEWAEAELGLNDERAEALLDELYEREGAHEYTTAERCYVARQRSAERVQALCAELGVSKPWFYVMERSGNERLVRFWQERGFTF